MGRPLSSLTRLIGAFPRRRLLVVGDLVADHYIYGQTERVSREAPVLVVQYQSAEVKLGGGANAAANARSLGGKVTALGLVGRDQMGRALGQLCAAAGIDLRRVGGGQTETKTRIYAGGINTTRQQMLRLDFGARAPLAPKVRRALANKLVEEAAKADAVMVSDYGAGVVCPEVQEVLRGLAASGMIVCADSRYQLEAMVGLQLCKPNEPELEALTGIPIRSEADLVRAGKAGRSRLGCQSLVVTRGRNGMAVFGPKGVELIPAHGASGAVDVTGAGDTVLAVLTLALAAGAKVVQAAQLANIAGALVVQKQGTATVTRQELEAELGKRR